MGMTPKQQLQAQKIDLAKTRAIEAQETKRQQIAAREAAAAKRQQEATARAQAAAAARTAAAQARTAAVAAKSQASVDRAVGVQTQKTLASSNKYDNYAKKLIEVEKQKTVQKLGTAAFVGTVDQTTGATFLPDTAGITAFLGGIGNMIGGNSAPRYVSATTDLATYPPAPADDVGAVPIYKRPAAIAAAAAVAVVAIGFTKGWFK
ncbi:MAG TPA: hypothetical protein VGN72_04285 [Tepidisphaeraceae bacterium]|nr:hypothetical protein [Tepidisphaeraceae bacterium]